MWLNSLHSYSQWPGLLSLNNDRSWKNATIFCLHTFDFLMTGAGNSDNCFVFTLSLSWWPEPEKKQKLFCLHTFTFMELFFNQSQGLTGIRLFPRAGIYKRARCWPAPDYTSSLPPQEVGAATFVLLPLVVIFLATQTQLFVWPFTPVVETLLPSSNEILYWQRQTYKRMHLTRESSVCHWLLRKADPSR